MDSIDLKIVSGIRNGEKQAFNLMFEQYYEKLCNYVASILFDFEVSEDLIQDLFASIWVNRKKLVVKSSFQSYLFRSSYYAALDYLKHQKIQQQFFKRSFDSTDSSFTDSLVTAEMHEKVESAIENLPDQCKNIFKMSRFENLKYREIASKLKISENTVDTQIRRALKKLKDELKDYLVTILIIIYCFF